MGRVGWDGKGGTVWDGKGGKHDKCECTGENE